MTRAVLPLLGLLVAAAAPTGSFTTTAPVQGITPQAPQAAPATPPAFTAAPTPNQDRDAPHTRASNETSVSPNLFTRHDQYRGEGLSPNSSAQLEQDRRAKPGAGISLTMPLH